MASLKYELDQWNEGVIAFDQGLYEDALEIFEPIADSAKIHFNIGVVLTTLGDFEGASASFTRATNLDQFLAIAYFQNGVANVALEDYGKALSCFHDAFLYLRGNMVIDYTQLGLDFKLYSCQVLFNRALCYLELGEHDLGMTDMWRATREKQTKAHDMLDQALRDKGQDCTVFTVPQGVLYRPAESKVKNAKKKDYLGNSKVIAALDAKDAFSGFQGKSAWQVQMSGPTNVAAVEEPRPMTPPLAGLQRRATERAPAGNMGMNGRARRGTDPEQRPQLEHSASFNGVDNKSRRGQQTAATNGVNNASLLGPSLLRSSSAAGKGAGAGRLSLLSRRNTDNQRPARLNLGSSSNLKRGVGPASAAPTVPLPALPLAPMPTEDIISVNAVNAAAMTDAEKAAAALREFYQDDMEDDLDQHVYALSIEAQEITIVDKPSHNKAPSNTSSTDIRVSPIPTRSNSRASQKGGSSILRKTSQNSGTSSSSASPPMPSSILPPHPSTTYYSDYIGSSPPSRTGTPPIYSDLRRVGSNGKNGGATGLWRGDSVRSTASGGSGGGSGAYNQQQQQPNHGDHLGFMNGAEGSYLDEPVYAGLRNKLRVKCHYIDTRAVLVRADTPLEELVQRIQEKFQADRPLKLKYQDEDRHMLSMVDDEDWLMAQQVHIGTTGSLDRMELWCFDEE